MINQFGWQGEFVIEVKNKITGKVTKTIIKNRVMDSVLNKLAETLIGVAPNLELKYLALGTGTTAITDSDTALDTEIFRTAESTAPARTALGQIETEFMVLDFEAVATIEEIGIFVGSGATGSADSGTLLSRILWHYEKTNREEITFKRIDRVVRS